MLIRSRTAWDRTNRPLSLDLFVHATPEREQGIVCCQLGQDVERGASVCGEHSCKEMREGCLGNAEKDSDRASRPVERLGFRQPNVHNNFRDPPALKETPLLGPNVSSAASVSAGKRRHGS